MSKVSVMLPTYNAEEFIVECLDSILSQNYKDFEIVISDDCSTDNTAMILRRYKAEFPSQIVLNLNVENLGITRNCNKALSLCTGDYVCFFAGDDLMLPGKISQQAELLDGDEEASFCYHRVEVFSSVDDQVIEVTESKRSIFSFLDIIERGGLPGANSVMAKRCHIPSVGYNARIPAVSDWLFFIELGLRGKIIFCEKVLARYRKHLGGCSAKADLLIGETLENVELILRRFESNPKIVDSCRKAKIRYLLGSIARLVGANDKLQLNHVNTYHVRKESFLLYVFVLIYLRSGMMQLGGGSAIFKALKFIKSKFLR